MSHKVLRTGLELRTVALRSVASLNAVPALIAVPHNVFSITIFNNEAPRDNGYCWTQSGSQTDQQRG